MKRQAVAGDMRGQDTPGRLVKPAAAAAACLRDLVRGLLLFPDRVPAADAARAIEERYRQPRRCC